MFTIRMSEISATAGNAADGIVRGIVDQSLLSYASTNVEGAEPIYAFNVDLVGPDVYFTDYSNAASGLVGPNSFLIWSSDANFTAGDSGYLAADEPCTRIRFTVDTSGVWTSSTGGGVTLWDSTDGVTANRQLTGVVDPSNGFRAAPGTYEMTWTDPVIPRVAFSPVPGVIASRKWIVVKPDNYSASVTSPKLSTTYISGSTGMFENETAVYNKTPPDDVFGVVEDVIYNVGYGDVFTFSSATIGLDLLMYRKATASRTTQLEYYALDGTWKVLTGASDPSNWMLNGPTTLGDPMETYHLRWPIPTDWQNMPLTFDLEVGGLPVPTTITGWHMRSVILTVSSVAAHPPGLARARARSLSAAGAVFHLAAATYNVSTFEVGVPALTDCVVELVNINTGATATMTIPAATRSSAELALERIPLSAPLSIGQGDALLITWLSGGTVQDVELVLQ
jgi:hypothetical protein